MAVNDLAILAGEGGTSLAYVGDPSTALDTALATLDVDTDLTGTGLSTLKDAGWISEDGLVSGRDFSTDGLPAYGTRSPVRVFVTTDNRTFTINFLETNPTTVAVYEGLALANVTADAGLIDVEIGGPGANASYSFVFDVVDGERGTGRIIVPRADVTAVTERTIRGGQAIIRGVTVTAKPVEIGATGSEKVVAVRELWMVNSLVA